MVSKSMTINIPKGLEARPVALLVQVASQYESSIYVEIQEKKVNAKSIMSTHRRLILLTLATFRPPGYVRFGRFTSSMEVIVSGRVSSSIGDVCARLQVVSIVSLAMMLSTRGQPLASMLVAVVLLTSSLRRNGISPRMIEPRCPA